MRRIPRNAKTTKKVSVSRVVEQPPATPEAPAAKGQPLLLFWVALLLSLFVLGTYVRIYDARDGWTRLDGFGAEFADRALPRLKRVPHYTMSDSGRDGQFYAQMAIDPSLHDPAFNQALDNPTYRARRIGVPAVCFCFGLGKPRWIVQVYALSNLFCWFLLLGVLVVLYRPWTGKQVLCLAMSLLSFGSLASMSASFIDLPAAAMICSGFVVVGWGRFGAFAAATLTRETSVLAAVACLNWRRPWTLAVWKRNLVWLTVAVAPFTVWMVYVTHRFHHFGDTAGNGNFAWPLQAMGARFAQGIHGLVNGGVEGTTRAAGPFGWLYVDYSVHEMLTIVSIFCQGVYLICRRDLNSPIWRTGVCFTLLACILGPDVWAWTGAAARVLLPMTLCFYLLLAKERDAWFAPFFALGSSFVPFAVHEFWTL